MTPILSIDRHPVGDGVIGPLTAMARDAYFSAVRDGSAPHPEWRAMDRPRRSSAAKGGAMLISIVSHADGKLSDEQVQEGVRELVRKHKRRET